MNSQTEFGITGNLDNGIPIFIPKSKMKWFGGKEYQYHLSRFYDVFIVGLNERNDGLIGSFKEIVDNPLKNEFNKIEIGSILACTVNKCKEDIIYLSIKGISPEIKGVLFKNEISNKFFIKGLENQFKYDQLLMLKVKEINPDKKSVVLSLKDQLITEIYDITNYSVSYEGVIIDRLINGDYSILNLDVMAEGTLQSDLKFEKGNYLKMRLLSQATSVYTNV